MYRITDKDASNIAALKDLSMVIVVSSFGMFISTFRPKKVLIITSVVFKTKKN